MNVLDSIICAINPIKGEKRLKARMNIKRYDLIQNSGYSESGANRRKNSMKGWNARSESPQKDIDLNLNLLRQRSRSLYMENPIATSAVKTTRTNVVGSGLMVKPKIDYVTLGISEAEAAALEEDIKKEFKLWAESKFCDACHQSNFYELQQIAFLSVLMSGEVFALPIYRENEESYMPYQMRIKLIEADRVSTPDSTGDYIDLHRKAENGNRIWNGVEIDSKGAAVAYYICNAYPYDYEVAKKEWVRVETFGEQTGNPNVLHVFDAERPEQYRGVPFLSPVIETLKQLSRYSEAELMAAVINGMFTVFITSENGTESVDFEGAVDEPGIENPKEKEQNYQIGPGTVNYMSPGEKIEIADAKRPNVNFDGFVSSFCAYVGAALEIPVDLLIKRFNASYSASRGALLEAWKSFRMRRTWFKNDFCQPIYELFLSESVAKGRLNMPGFFLDIRFRKAYCEATWNGPSPGQLDPVKEAQAAELRVKNGFSTAEREATEINGSDFDYNVSQRKAEIEKMKEAGMIGGDDN